MTTSTPHDMQDNNPKETHYFDPATEKSLREEDSEAWNAVTGLLLTIVSMGLLLAVLSLFILV